LKEVTAKGLDVAAMLLSRTSKLLAGLQQPTFLAGLQQPTSNLIQKSSKNGSGSNLFSTAPALCINKHPDVIRGKVGCKGSLWPDKFEEPLKSRKAIAEIRGTPEFDRKVNVPIKAAEKDASCSMFRDPLVTKFFNVVVEGSSGQLAEEIMLNTCRRIKEFQMQKWLSANEERRAKVEMNPYVIIVTAIENCRPVMQLEKVKVGSVTYHVPTPITDTRSYFEAMRWLHKTGRWDRDVSAADRVIPNSMKPHEVTDPKFPQRARVTIADGLAKELVDAYNLVGRAIAKKYEHHKQCEQNRAYAHYRRTK